MEEDVDFYLSGHDHSLQYLKLKNEEVHYLVSGGGSESTPVTAHSHARFSRSIPGFLVITLYAEKARFYFYNASGGLLYSNEVSKQ